MRVQNRDSKNYTIQVGSADAYVQGEKTYTLSYDYAMGKDPLQNADELSFNIVGTSGNVRLQMFPGKFICQRRLMLLLWDIVWVIMQLPAMIRIYYKVPWRIRRLRVSYAGNLDAYEGITVRCTLPERDILFTKINYMPYVLIALVVLLCGILFWFRKEDKGDTVISFEPPKDTILWM